ncbi:hypothetical protein BC629DRAFT_1577204 [Irpex lacteus]|nr:hypothetical protein BC629DRAFT_1577204 [Irpex lacteus]
MRASVFHFVFEEAPATDLSASALSVVGVHAYIHMYEGFPANFDAQALVDHARTLPTIRALVLLFQSSDRLLESKKPFVEVLQVAMAPENVELVLAYKEEEEEGKAVGVDLVTLKTNGRIWLGVHWSDDILRQELKKRR